MTPTIWNRFSQSCTAEAMMTPRTDLHTWEIGTDREPVGQAAEQRAYDLVPVTAGGRIEAVWNRAGGGEPEPLSAGWLVPATAGIPELVRQLVDGKRPGLLVARGDEVVGLVTPADLNKMAVRGYVYQLVAELERALAGLLRREFEGRPERMVALLSSARRKTLADQERRAKAGDVTIDLVQILYLPDLLEIVSESKGLRTLLGYPSSKEAKRLFSGLMDLRLRTMHPLRSLLEYKHELGSLNTWLERAQELLQRVERALALDQGGG